MDKCYKKNKKRKIKWDNVISTILLIICVVTILRELMIITIYWLLFEYAGFITFIVCILVASIIYADFKKQFKKMSKNVKICQKKSNYVKKWEI